jgi:hypothetical protein
MSISEHAWQKPEQFLALLAQLNEVCPDGSIFSSAEWCSAWLNTFGEQLHPEMYSLNLLGSERACWMLVRRTESWHGIPVRRVYVSTAGEDESDSPCVEYNTVVSQPEFFEKAMEAVWETIQKKPYDEIVFPAAVPDSAKAFATAGAVSWPPPQGMTVIPTRYVDLDSLRSSQKKYLDALSQKARYQVRQSLKACTSYGDLSLRQAETQQQALEIFSELAELHGKAWSARSHQGAFTSARFLQFHRTLIESVFTAGKIQMIKVAAGDVTIGCLYNFICDGVSYYYQSGLKYDLGAKHFRPGFVTLALAIQHCLDLGLREFDMMGGDYEYKRSLSTGQRQLISLSLPSANWKTRFIDVMRKAKQSFSQLSRRRTISVQGPDV